MVDLLCPPTWLHMLGFFCERLCESAFTALQDSGEKEEFEE